MEQEPKSWALWFAEFLKGPGADILQTLLAAWAEMRLLDMHRADRRVALMYFLYADDIPIDEAIRRADEVAVAIRRFEFENATCKSDDENTPVASS